MLLPSHGGDGRGGVGSCRIGRGGAFSETGSVTPGMAGIRGGKEIWRLEGTPKGMAAEANPTKAAIESLEEGILNNACGSKLELIEGD